MRRVSHSSPSRVLATDDMQCTLADLDAIFKEPHVPPLPFSMLRDGALDCVPRTPGGAGPSRPARAPAPASAPALAPAPAPARASRDVLINSLLDDPMLGIEDVPLLDPDIMLNHGLDNDSD